MRQIGVPLLSSPAYPPLSSRGLGRRILSPETRVRIPVAVAGALADPLDQADEILTTIPLVASELNEPSRTIKQADSSIEAVHESVLEREDAAGGRFSEESDRLSRVDAPFAVELEADVAVEPGGFSFAAPPPWPARLHPERTGRRASAAAARGRDRPRGPSARRRAAQPILVRRRRHARRPTRRGASRGAPPSRGIRARASSATTPASAPRVRAPPPTQRRRRSARARQPHPRRAGDARRDTAGPDCRRRRRADAAPGDRRTSADG